MAGWVDHVPRLKAWEQTESEWKITNRPGLFWVIENGEGEIHRFKDLGAMLDFLDAPEPPRQRLNVTPTI